MMMMRPLTYAISAFALTGKMASAITCTKSKNNGGILLYGNFDWDGGWIEVHRDDPTPGESYFDLMFEMDCDDPSRLFDFEVYKDGDASQKVESVSFYGQAIPYTHHFSPSIDHSIFRMDSFTLATGYYTYQIRSAGETDWHGGTIKSLGDVSVPEFVTGPTDQSVVQGEVSSMTFPIVVKDDAILDYLQITSNGEYVKRIGLKTKNYKVATSTEDRTVTDATVPIPTTGKAQDQLVAFHLCDDVGRCVIEEATIAVTKSGGGGGRGDGGDGETCTLGQKGDACASGGSCCSGKCRGGKCG